MAELHAMQQTGKITPEEFARLKEVLFKQRDTTGVSPRRGFEVIPADPTQKSGGE